MAEAAAPWTCPACTYRHDGAEAGFLQCSMCGGSRDPAAPPPRPPLKKRHPRAPDRYLLERAGRVLHAGTTDGFPNLTKPELRELAATARALVASAEAEIDARPVAFPTTLPPWLVMQWLSFRDVSAALRVASSWRGDTERYFRVFAERHCVARSPTWREAVRVWEVNRRSGRLSAFQKRVLAHYAHRHRVCNDPRFIPVKEVAAALPGATVEQVRTAAGFLVTFQRSLYFSARYDGHSFIGLYNEERSIVDYYARVGTSDAGCEICETALAHSPRCHFDYFRRSVDFLCAAGYLYSTIDDDHHKATEEATDE